MHVYIGSDHGGFDQKNTLYRLLAAGGATVSDCGPQKLDPDDDYPFYAQAVAEAVRRDEGSLGLLLCRSGEGMAMAANKVPGIRAALVWKKEVAVETRRDNDANVLVLPSDFVSAEKAADIVRAFLHTPFSGEERHKRRIAQISSLEASHEG